MFFHTVAAINGGARGNCPRAKVLITIKAAAQSGQIKVTVVASPISLLSITSLSSSSSSWSVLFLSISSLRVSDILSFRPPLASNP